MTSLVERTTGIPLRDQSSAFLMMFGHAGTHWISAAFYILLPFMSKDLGLSYAQAGQLAAIMHLFSFLANAFSGVIVDLTGRKAAIGVAALLANAAAMMGFAVTGSFFWLAVLVAVIGVSVNVWHPAAIALLTERYPNTKGYAMSVHVLGANLGDAAAPLIAGVLLGWMTWQQTAVYSAAPAVAIAVVVAVALLPNESRTIKSHAKEGKKSGMGVKEYVHRLKPIVRNRFIISLCAMAGFRSVTLVGVFTFLPMYLADVINMDPFWMGVTLTAMQIGGVISSPVAGAWSDKAGCKRVLVAGLTLTTLAVFAVIAIGDSIALIAGVSVLGFALFGVRGVIQSWMMDAIPASMRGTGTSLLFGTQSAMGTLAPLIGGMIADAWDLDAVFYMLAGTILIANVIVVFLPKDEDVKPISVN